jgi:hypothetical protein
LNSSEALFFAIVQIELPIGSRAERRTIPSRVGEEKERSAISVFQVRTTFGHSELPVLSERIVLSGGQVWPEAQQRECGAADQASHGESFQTDLRQL